MENLSVMIKVNPCNVNLYGVIEEVENDGFEVYDTLQSMNIFCCEISKAKLEQLQITYGQNIAVQPDNSRGLGWL